MVDYDPAAVATLTVEESNQNLDVQSNVSGLKSDSSTLIKTNKGGQNVEETLESFKMQLNALGISDDEKSEVKKQLQKYARQRNFDLPVYSCECDQGPEATHFKATVTVGDQIFESSEFFNTLKDAESDAAKVALIVENFQEDESRVYKNLLQELVQRENLSTPVYKTIKHGEPHKPIFFTSVELDGEIFHGKAAKSKKQAELNAARAAYVALKERGSTQIDKFTSCSLRGHAPKSTSSPEVTCDLLQNLKHQCILAPYPAQTYVEAKEKIESAEAILSTVAVDSSSSYPAITPHMEKMIGAKKVSSVRNSNTRNGEGTDVKSYLLCNKVRVYRQLPNYPFPEDITVLPISDDKWVAVSLEFPNEEKN
ncbi:double-stranded RNA-binding protein 1-like isoform X2 [Humulus lupulus]|uniref:double-stranded RNA-binding protein 1-like isoform X2 n=1 Tax=Humulus lupulus TaxID=3486 RepID=UPI002B4166E9|nr:double-stranded RNA-binding protein 1-like isoform X2 [Humulus lupulus]